MKGDLPEGAFDALNAKIAELIETKPAQATRQSSGAALDQVFASIPELVGGSADLTGSNNTFVAGTPILDTPSYEGRYVNWGIREFGMAAAMNGLALHGGIIPYAGTFMVFSDYSRPAIRLGALMGVRAIHVLTHDSIGLGEDGPTHQPVEHLAALRAIPNLNVFRPADTVEAMECWKIALETKTASLAAARRTEADLARIEDALLLMEADVESGGRGVEGDEHFHAAVTAAAHSLLLSRLMAEIADLIRETRIGSLSQPGRPRDSLAGHRAIADAIRAGDPNGAARAMHAHVEMVSDVAVLRDS